MRSLLKSAVCTPQMHASIPISSNITGGYVSGDPRVAGGLDVICQSAVALRRDYQSLPFRRRVVMDVNALRMDLGWIALEAEEMPLSLFKRP